MILHRRQSSARDRGATILEFLVYLAVIAVVLTSATMFAFEFAASRAKAAALAEVTRNGDLALSRIALEVRESAGINVGASTFGTNPGVLSLATANPATDPTVFAISSGALTVTRGLGPTLPLTSSQVEAVEFVVDDVSTAGRTKAVRIRLKLRRVNVDDLKLLFAESVFESTARVQKSDGFSN